MSDRVIQKIQESDFYKELLQKEQADLLEKRTAAAAALASVDAETQKKATGLAQTIQEAEKTCAECEKSFQEAKNRVKPLTAQRMGLSHAAESTKSKHESFLAETTDPRIDMAVKLKELAERLPDPDDFFETDGRKPERDVSDAPFLARFPSDELHRMQMDNLTQQAENLKRKRA